ncbi:MAG: trigger factor [Selenomonadaceae bacterium]|nr:trigger factor [Selenomonadaceae bacterium]
MKVTTEKIENQQVVLEITVPAEELEKAYAQAFKNISKQVNIPGFRKGKAPKKMVEKHVGVEYIMDEAFKTVYNASFGEAVDESKQVPVSRVDLEEVQLELGKDVIYKTTFTAKPEVKLGQYKEVKVAKADTTVSDADVDAQLARMLDRQADMVDAEEGAAVENGNFITLDFKGTVDGEAFAGGESKDYPLEVGSNSFIPGFEEQLVGMKVGEEKDVNVTFPEDYHSEELKGKAAVFACKVNSIKRKVLPAMDDEFAKKASTFETLDELKADVRKNLQTAADNKAVNEKREAVLDAISEAAEVEIPNVMIETRINNMINQMAMNIEQQGMKLEQYLQFTGTDMSKLRENCKETAQKNVRIDLVLEAVATAEGIKVEDADLQAEIAGMAAQYGATPAQIKKIIAENGQIGSLIDTIMRRKAMELVVSSAVESDEVQA